jgi:membrane fusion protein, multidrug efflux system
MAEAIHGRDCRPPAPAVALAIGILLGVTGCQEPVAQATREPAEVTVVRVQPRTIPVVTSRVAQTESSRQVEVVARVAGFLDRISFQEGGLVRAGDVMFEIDRKPLDAQLDIAEGEVRASLARLATANANLARTRPLAAADAISQSDLDRAVGEQQAAEAALYTARARLSQAELNRGYALISSPVNGMAGRAEQREGAFLNPNGASANLAYVAQLDPIWVNFSVSQNEAQRRHQRTAAGLYVPPPDGRYEVEIVLPGGEVFPHVGTLQFADPSFDRRTGTFSVRASVPNPDLALRPGMFVTAILKGATRPNAIAVPQRAVQKSPAGHVVWLVNGEGIVEQRAVTVGDWIGDDWLIERGLGGGENLVIEGSQRLAAGAPVRVLTANEPHRAAAR